MLQELGRGDGGVLVRDDVSDRYKNLPGQQQQTGQVDEDGMVQRSMIGTLTERIRQPW